MLGKFLEISIHAPDIKASYEFYEGLGFRSVDVGEIWSHPYAVLSDGAIFLGLHAYRFDSPALTFVCPNLGAHSRALKRQGIRTEFEKLSNDEFNELGFLDPTGQMITLLEARTFSPASFDTLSFSLCGDFVEFTRAAANISSVRSFWEALGLLPGCHGEQPHPWLRLIRDDINLGFHLTENVRPGLTFFAEDMATRVDYLEASGHTIVRSAPVAGGVTLTALEGTPLYLYPGQDYAGAVDFA